MLERLFGLQERGTSVATEVRGGVATYLTLAYILFVNPQILAQAGMPADDVLAATILASALATLVMGLWANLPFALAPGMGLNAYFAFAVVGAMGVSWRTALAAVFVEGLLFLVLSLVGLRSALVAAIPDAVKAGTMAGIGLFLALIGMQNAGLVVDHPATLVTLGPLHAPTCLAAVGVVLVAVLMVRKVPGTFLWVILSLAGVAWVSGLAPAPASWLAAPHWPSETFLAFLGAFIEPDTWTTILPIVFAFFFVDFLDTAGTLVGVGRLAGLENDDGEMQGTDRAFTADAIGTTAGAILGTSTVTTYIESAAGIEEGGRTGLTAVTVSGLFLASMFLAPVFIAVPALATAPVLIVLGVLMMRGVADVDWRDLSEGLPAFLTLVVMPFTFSIAHGIAAGLVSWVAIRLLTGRWRDVRPMLAVLVAALVTWYALA